MKISTFLRALSLLLLLSTASAARVVDVTFYSETQYDSRIDGSTTDNRIRLQSEPVFSRLMFYAGLQYSQDLTNGRAPLLAENAVAPTLGLQLKLLPSIVLFTELRRLYRFQNATAKSNTENEARVGFFGYFYYQPPSLPFLFNETYFEGVSISRIDPQPVFAFWNKLGTDFELAKNLRHHFYLEAFSRQSPEAGYGPLENEIRFGTRLKYSHNQWSVGVLIHYALISNIKVNATDALLYLSKEAF